MDERFEGRREEVPSRATVAGAGAALVGVGVALAYLLSKGRPRDHHRLPTAHITIEEDGSVSHYDDLNVYVDPGRPRPYPVLWLVTNKGPRRVLSFENFERRHDDKKVTPLDREPGQRIRPVRGWDVDIPVPSLIDRLAVADVLSDDDRDRHKYKYDIWIDRVRQVDPEIAIIRR